MKQMWVEDIINHVGSSVVLEGWISNRRDHGKIIFLDLRDRSGMCQTVCGPWTDASVYAVASTLRSEWVVRIEGEVKKRPDNMVNNELATGQVEIDIHRIEVLNESQTPPFAIHESDGYDVKEELRMKYRYLDLRRKRLSSMLGMRHRIIHTIRQWLDQKGFFEVETPILTRSTPEGARDYVVPSRLHQGSFYALPQAPQQYKQLLMASGVERYFQIARCFRDEDTRGDRQPEFTQMDLEISFVDREDVMQLNEELLVHLVETLFPEKHISQRPFPRLTYKEAMETYGTDRPDLRNDTTDPHELAFGWIVDFPFFEKTDDGGWTFTHNPFSAPQEKYIEDVVEKKNIDAILTTQYDVVLNGFEIGGGSIRAHQPHVLRSVLSIIGYSDEDIEAHFGHMLKAFSLGIPPHGGIAWGLDRLISLLLHEPNIREVIAFPKTGDGRDLLMDAPAPLSQEQLHELHLTVEKKKDN